MTKSAESLNHCPGCAGPADNGHDRCLPPNPYFCTKCMKKEHDMHKKTDNLNTSGEHAQSLNVSHTLMWELEKGRQNLHDMKDINGFMLAMGIVKNHESLQTQIIGNLEHMIKLGVKTEALLEYITEMHQFYLEQLIKTPENISKEAVSNGDDTLIEERERLISFARENHDWSQDWQKGVEDAFHIFGRLQQQCDPKCGTQYGNLTYWCSDECANKLRPSEISLKNKPFGERLHPDVSRAYEKWVQANHDNPFIKGNWGFETFLAGWQTHEAQPVREERRDISGNKPSHLHDAIHGWLLDNGYKYDPKTVNDFHDRVQPFLKREYGKRPIETAPKGIPVIVAGGLAMQKTGGEWFTGMEDPRYERPLEWQPKWWMPIPTDNEIEVQAPEEK